jgi:hypothetical protein
MSDRKVLIGLIGANIMGSLSPALCTFVAALAATKRIELTLEN